MSPQDSQEKRDKFVTTQKVTERWLTYVLGNMAYTYRGNVAGTLAYWDVLYARYWYMVLLGRYFVLQCGIGTAGGYFTALQYLLGPAREACCAALWHHLGGVLCCTLVFGAAWGYDVCLIVAFGWRSWRVIWALHCIIGLLVKPWHHHEVYLMINGGDGSPV